jgi:hypothetical protein
MSHTNESDCSALLSRIAELEDGLREIAVWTQQDQDDHETCAAQWRGCVAIARELLKGNGVTPVVSANARLIDALKRCWVALENLVDDLNDHLGPLDEIAMHESISAASAAAENAEKLLARLAEKGGTA